MTRSQKIESWISNKWRPAMGWMYLVVCIFDFVIFPVWWAMFLSSSGAEVTAWQPLTLQGAGLFHMAMGAIVGVTAWNRTREKMAQLPGDQD